MKKYKVSKYNTIISKGKDILIYNSLKGIDSLCKLDAEKWNKLIKSIDAPNKKANELIINDFIEKGIIIDSDLDEEILRKYKHNNVLNNNLLNLILMPTEKCNFRCDYCYEDFKKGAMDNKTVDAIVKYVKENIHKYSSVEVDWFGGEPLLERDLISSISDKIIQICRTSRKGYISTMTTNGYFLTADTVKILIQKYILSYQVTIDGTAKYHNKHRKLHNGQGTYNEIINNLISIRDQIKSNTVSFTIRVNLSRGYEEFFEEYLKVIRNEFSEDKRFNISLRYVVNLSETDKNLDKYLRKEEMGNIFDKASQYIPDMLSRSFISFLTRPQKCYAAKKGAFTIGSDGTIYKCTAHFNKEFNNIGSIKKNNVNDYKIALWMYSDSSDSVECQSCTFSGNCIMGTCPYGSITKNLITCPLEINHIEYILTFLDKQKLIKHIGRNYD